MRRDEMLEQVENYPGFWDVIVIGGGATGLGVGVDSAARGYKTLLLEQHDFSKGTSSRSTKLVHGGVRYLQQGNISLVVEALHERGLLINNAPHLVSHQSFIVPNYEWWDGPFYGVGLKVYDLLAGKLGLGPSKMLSLEETRERIPTLEPEGLRGGVIYYDGQFDDSRLAINLAQTMADEGGTILNYARVTDVLKPSNGMVNGVVATDLENDREYNLNARVVINATGIFTDDILKMDDSDSPDIMSLSQGIHLVLDQEFLPGDSAIMVPQTDDGRVLFAVPWHNHVIVGTTDTPVESASLEPYALEDEVEFILKHAAKYLTKDPVREDVKSVFAGIRPLVSLDHDKKTSSISRDHHLMVSHSGLVTITGGKWTTYRKMAEDTVDQAAMVAGLNVKQCPTRELRIHGWLKNADRDNPLHYYGSDSVLVQKIIEEDPSLGEPLHENFEYTKAEVVWAAREEMARTVEDVLARRTRMLFLDAQASMECAEVVADLLARELGNNKSWKQDQMEEYSQTAHNYLL